MKKQKRLLLVGIMLFMLLLSTTNYNASNINTNSLINIKIPLTEDLKGYENYKVVYINDKNEITDELFEVKVSTDYLEFNTTHLSVFGIIGTKKVVEEEKVGIKGFIKTFTYPEKLFLISGGIISFIIWLINTISMFAN